LEDVVPPFCTGALLPSTADVIVVCNGRAGLTVTAFTCFNKVPDGSIEKLTSVSTNSKIGVLRVLLISLYGWRGV
jgi:hypothetical protein